MLNNILKSVASSDGDGDSYSISFSEGGGSRSAFRTVIPGLKIVLESGEACAVQDISSGGLGFSYQEEHQFAAGTILRISLWVADRLYIEQLQMSVVRYTSAKTVACRFVELSRQQEIRLDKLILEMQKRIIAQRRAQEAATDGNIEES